MANPTRRLSSPWHVPLHARTPRRRTALLLLVALSMPLSACEQPAVRWLDDAPVVTTQPSPLAHDPLQLTDTALADTAALASFLLTQDLLRETGAVELVASHLVAMPASTETLPAAALAMSMALVPPAPLTALGEGEAPLDSMRCARSLRVARAPARGRVAVWWSRRDRGRVLLLSAWRDGLGASEGPWRGPIVVDSLDQGPRDAQAGDRGSVSCARPAPSLVVDDTHGYVHVAYALTGPEGPGVFYAHQMDPRSAFEPPRIIVYGEKLGAVRVAAAGDLVAIAYEDPNSGARSRVALTISRTSGHDFAERLTASADNANARDPWVAVRGRAVVVGWSDVAAGSEPTFRVRRARVE